ncbi:MAG TPA: NAD-binding protein [Actinomycetota bacterium]|nr:NAD-binding protein [Actinomycetota bacterium]
MAVLLVGLTEDVGAVLIKRLIDEDDEVRVVESDDGLAVEWETLGAHVALGELDDEDLLERAGQYARTMVVFTEGRAEHALDPAVAAARRARIERVVVVAAGLSDETGLALLRASGLQYVALDVARTRKGFIRRSGLEADRLAEAIDAADDLAGEPRLELDLADAGAWSALRLEPPATPR